MKKLPIGIQTFEKIIEENMLYVDKTEYIYNFVTTGETYFLSRPRRFGKSLLISTFKSLFEGRRDLFKDLWIDGSDYDWRPHPVIAISFARIAFHNPEVLRENLIDVLNDHAHAYGCTIGNSKLPGRVLSELVVQLARQHGKVVILIDEYDYAILKHLTNSPHLHEIHQTLQGFYATIKDLDAHLRFVFITGVSKFSRTSIFSGMNNLKDLTMNTSAATLLGYTHEELISNFDGYITAMADQQKMTFDETVQKLTDWYDGYRFTEEQTYVYNPFSILLCLDEKKIKNYWFETGTPTFLAKLILAKKYAVQDIKATQANAEALGSMDVDDIKLLPLMQQTGYLTLSNYDPETKMFTLDYPNREVELSFMFYLFSYFAKATGDGYLYALNLSRAFKNGDIAELCKQLKILFADIPYTIQLPYEKFYQSIFYMICKLMGVYIQVEVATNAGRIDAVVFTNKNIYIVEFKIDTVADEALDQIFTKRYYEKYLNDGREIIPLGITFDMKTKNVRECAVRTLEKN